MANRKSVFVPLSEKFATHNLPLPSALTFQQKKGSPTIPSNIIYLKRLTCASTGSKIVKAKASSLYTGNLVAPTFATTTQKTTRPPIIVSCATITCIPTQLLPITFSPTFPKYVSSLLCPPGSLSHTCSPRMGFNILAKTQTSSDQCQSIG